MSNFIFFNLTGDIRQLMLAEIQHDTDNEKLYISPRLNETGRKIYTSFLINAVKKGNDETFQADLESGSYFNPTYLRQGKPAKMPSNAAQILAQNEFNRFYIRAICLKAIEQRQSTVEVYRARESSATRPESEMKVGSQINAIDLLNDLRGAIGTTPHILPEVNSGLSVKL